MIISLMQAADDIEDILKKKINKQFGQVRGS